MATKPTKSTEIEWADSLKILFVGFVGFVGFVAMNVFGRAFRVFRGKIFLRDAT